MNYARIGLALLGATVSYFACGLAMFGALPGMKTEFKRYPNVYRPDEGMMKVMPYNMGGILISILVVVVLFAKVFPAGGSIVSGVWFGALIGIFSVCTYVIHSYALLNIGFRLSIYEGITYFIQWVLVGVVTALIYKPA